jgi:inorganic pyrophosphatase
MSSRSLLELETVDPKTGALGVIIETPKGSRNKYKFDEKLELFRLSGVLPEGAVFPFEFGFLPSTKAADGDPLDVIVLVDGPTSVGCLVMTRLIGVIEAEQTEHGHTVRNDRLITVATHAHLFAEIKSLTDMSGQTVDELEHFFVSITKCAEQPSNPWGGWDPSER